MAPVRFPVGWSDTWAQVHSAVILTLPAINGRGSWFSEATCHSTNTWYRSRGHLSPSVCFLSEEEKPVPWCPQVRSKQSCPPFARHPLAVRRECALLRDSTLALALFPGKHVRVFTSGPTPLNPYTIQLSRYYWSILLQGLKVEMHPTHAPSKERFFIPWFKHRGFQIRVIVTGCSHLYFTHLHEILKKGRSLTA